jgi:hypothetical protein
METLPTVRESPIVSLISNAVSNNATIETLERLFALYQKDKADHAKAEFDLAKAKFQYECPVIPKTKAARDENGRIMYRYAPIEVIQKVIKPHLYSNGFSYSFRGEDIPEQESVIAHVTLSHIAGHAETYPYPLPYIRQTKMMSRPHMVEGTLTQACRKGLSYILGIITEEDTNLTFGNKPELIDEEQVATIKELCLEKGIDVGKAILVPNKVDSLQQLTVEQASSIITKLQAAKSKKPVEPDDIPY